MAHPRETSVSQPSPGLVNVLGTGFPASGIDEFPIEIFLFFFSEFDLQ